METFNGLILLFILISNLTVSFIFMFLKADVSTYIWSALKKEVAFDKVLIFSLEIFDDVKLSSLKLLIFTIIGVPSKIKYTNCRS